MSDRNEENLKLKEALKEIHTQVNTWLSFAEAKNGALIGFNIALVSFIKSFKVIGKAETLKYFIVAGYIIATFVALFSFIPDLRKAKKLIRELTQEEREKTNLLYYRDIKKYNASTYIIELCKRYLNQNVENNQIERYMLDLAEEIIQNSRISSRKYITFLVALCIDFIMIDVLLIGIFIIRI